MRFTLLTVGSRGDVQPMVALGQGLQRAGHDVRFATFPNFRELIEGAGLSMAPLCAPALGSADDTRALVESSDSLFRHVQVIRRISRKLVDTPGYWESVEEACRNADAIVYHHTAPQGFHMAEKLQVPGILAAAVPVVVPTGAFSHPLWPVDPRLGRSVNRLTHTLCEHLMWLPFRSMINEWRRNRLGLAPASLRGPYPSMRRSLVLYAYSRTVLPPAPDWNANVRVTGYWVLNSPPRQPDSRLVRFLDEGPPPVFVGFGSVAAAGPNSLAALVQDALRSARKRGVLQVGDNNCEVPHSSGDFITVGEVPHDWIFPRTAAVVHSGGAGTTGAALRAGVPNVAVPFFSDQPFWARRIAALGAGPAPIPIKQLTVSRLAAAISAAVDDPKFRRNAAAVGESIRQEDGVQTAVNAIMEYLQSPAPGIQAQVPPVART